MPGYKRRYGFYQDGDVAMPMYDFWGQPTVPEGQGGIPGGAFLPAGAIGGAALLNRFGVFNPLFQSYVGRNERGQSRFQRPGFFRSGSPTQFGGSTPRAFRGSTYQNLFSPSGMRGAATGGFKPGVGMGRAGIGAGFGLGGYVADEALTAMGFGAAGDYAQAAGIGAGFGMMLGPTGALVGAAGAMGLKAVFDIFGKDKEPDQSEMFIYKAAPNTGLGQAQKLVANAPIPEEYANWMTPEQKQIVLTQAAQILGDDIAAGTEVGPGKNQVNNKKASLVVNGLITQYLEGKSAIDAQNAVYGAAGVKRGSSMLELAKATGNESTVLAQMKKSVFEQTTGAVSVGAGVDDDGSAYQIGMAPNGDYIKYVETGEGQYDPTESLMTAKQKLEFEANLSRELTGMDNEAKIAINANNVNAQLLGIASTARTADKALIQRSKEHIQNLGFDYNKLMQEGNQFNRAQDEVENQFVQNHAQRVFEFDADFGLRSDKFDFEKDVWGEEFAEGNFRDRRDYSEGVRRFDTEMAENRTQFDINDRRRLQQMQEEARRADASIAQELNQARQQTSDRMREILANPADYLARSYAQRGETSPFGETTQADLYNQAMGEYNQYAQYLDSLGRGFKADLAAEAQGIRNMRQRRELEAEEANKQGIAPKPPAADGDETTTGDGDGPPAGQGPPPGDGPPTGPTTTTNGTPIFPQYYDAGDDETPLETVDYGPGFVTDVNRGGFEYQRGEAPTDLSFLGEGAMLPVTLGNRPTITREPVIGDRYTPPDRRVIVDDLVDMPDSGGFISPAISPVNNRVVVDDLGDMVGSGGSINLAPSLFPNVYQGSMSGNIEEEILGPPEAGSSALNYPENFFQAPTSAAPQSSSPRPSLTIGSDRSLVEKVPLPRLSELRNLLGAGPFEHGGVAHGFGNPIVVGDSSKNKENQELVMSFGNAPMVVLPLNERQQEIMEDAGEVGPPRAQIGGMFGGNTNFSTLAEMPSRTAFGGTQFGFGMDRPVTQQEIRARGERFSSPAVRDIFAGQTPQSLRFGFNLFTPGQLQSLTGGEREELRTRLATRNRTLEDVEQQVMRQFGATGTRRGRRVF